jgi:hypothetical protein
VLSLFPCVLVFWFRLIFSSTCDAGNHGCSLHPPPSSLLSPPADGAARRPSPGSVGNTRPPPLSVLLRDSEREWCGVCAYEQDYPTTIRHRQRVEPRSPVYGCDAFCFEPCTDHPRHEALDDDQLETPLPTKKARAAFDEKSKSRVPASSLWCIAPPPPSLFPSSFARNLTSLPRVCMHRQPRSWRRTRPG